MGTKQFDNYADLITFTRASSATYLDSDGVLKTASTNIPRIEYDADGNRLGLLVEEQRTNLVTYSEDFSNAAWGKNDSSIDSNTIVAPDGTLTGDKTILDDGISSSTTTWLERTVGSEIPTGGVHTVTVFAKKAEAEELFIGFRNRTNVVDRLGAIFNLSTGVASNSQAESSSMVDVGNGWYRCVAVIDYKSGPATPKIWLGGYDLTTGDGTSGIYVWGAQLEEGSFPTSYIPTSGSTATRATDVASIPTSAFGYNASEGSVVADFKATALVASAGNPGTVLAMSDNTVNERIRFILAASSAYEIAVGGTQQVAIATSVSANTSYKWAGAYKTNDFAFSSNGAAVVTDTSGDVPVVSQMQIGNLLTNRELTGHIKSIKYYPRRLSNAQLQELTQ